MVVIKEIQVFATKTQILKAVSAYHDLSHVKDIDTVYNQMYDTAKQLVKPVCMFQMLESKGQLREEFKSSIIVDCQYVIFCAFTIGDAITAAVESLFEKDRFDDAILLDAISTSILFNISAQLYEQVFAYAKERKLGLTCRVAPGDGEIDIQFQKQIIELFRSAPSSCFRMENEYVVRPHKSITYVYGADANILINREDHHCERCHNKNCFMRNSEKRTRGSFQFE